MQEGARAPSAPQVVPLFLGTIFKFCPTSVKLHPDLHSQMYFSFLHTWIRVWILKEQTDEKLNFDGGIYTPRGYYVLLCVFRISNISY